METSSCSEVKHFSRQNKPLLKATQTRTIVVYRQTQLSEKSTHKGVNYRSKDVTQTKERPESPTASFTCPGMRLNARYIIKSTRGTASRSIKSSRTVSAKGRCKLERQTPTLPQVKLQPQLGQEGLRNERGNKHTRTLVKFLFIENNKTFYLPYFP